ncbi:uncharacterized protein Tco025E_08513 [Trypanosoma conorhini]|uniref:ATP synthase regulation protein NCA2 n=1 Tax=Trypanosoma conorhini TaxID=83891 RepID=A0A422N8K3_9TRYP|nr:uncharacterized protein Tco025E_08513 [Trypanosoma conorhini]RNF01766.1 hypothetical protein Tco025E_08513 [Trypanosoma conorhini]
MPSPNAHCFLSSCFAGALLTESRRTFLRFTHSPAVVEILSERPGVGDDMEACALSLHSLDDLAGLLQCIKAFPEMQGLSFQVPRFLRETFLQAFLEPFGSEAAPNSSSGVATKLIGWLQLVVWTRYFAVFSMRRLAAIHDQISWYVWYWSWAEMHSARASFHLSFGSQWWWKGVWRRGWVGQVLLVKSFAIAHKSALNRVLHGVVRCLGTMYGFLDRMNTLISSIEDVAAGERLLSPERDTSTSIDLEVNNRRLLSNLRATVVSTVKSMAQTMRSPGIAGLLDANSKGMPEDALGLGGHASESVMYDFHLYTPSSEAPNDIEMRASLKEVFNLLLDTAEFTRTYTKSISEEIHARHVPPNGRHWRRIFIAGCVIVPSVLWLSANSITNLRRMLASARVVGYSLFENYVIYPLKEIYQSLTSSRPGVLERRRTLEMEMESVANIIRDYHEDYYPNISQEELHRLRERTFEHLRSGVIADDEGYRLINDHYENAIRHPIRGAFFGSLLRLLLIQLSYQQLEVMRVVNSTDEVLEGNDLNFKMLAMVPVFLALSGALLASLQSRRAKLLPVNNQLKLYWRSVHRVVTIPENSVEEAYRSPSGEVASSEPSKDEEVVELEEAVSVSHLSSYDQGMLLLLTHHMRRLAVEYHAGYRYLEAFLEDLDDLESVRSTRHQRLLTLDRMRSVHYFLR